MGTLWRLALWLALVAGSGLNAAQHRSRLHANASITVLGIAEGPDGVLWLAANDGLYRFDGIHFDKFASFPFASARTLAVTEDGSVWIGGREGLARLRAGRFEVLLRGEVHSLVSLGRAVVLRTGVLTLARIGEDGRRLEIRHAGSPYLLKDAESGVWLAIRTAVRLDADRLRVVQEAPMPLIYRQAGRDSKGRIWAANATTAVELKADGSEGFSYARAASQKADRQPPLIAGRNGTLWFVGEVIRRLDDGLEFRDRALYDQFPATTGFEDSRGHFWVARMGLGLVEWIAGDGWERWFPESFAGERGLNVSRDRNGELLAATHSGLYRLEGGEFQQLAPERRPYDYLLPLSGGGLAASVRGIGLALLNDSGRLTGRAANATGSDRDFRKIVEDRKGRVWVGTKHGLLWFDQAAKTLRPAPLTAGDPMNEVADLEIDGEGRLWAGDSYGIAWQDSEDRWHKLPTSEPIPLVRSFTPADANGDDLWVAYRAPGRFSRLRRKGDRWETEQFAAADGFGPPDTHFVKRDSRGWIWRGSTDGVHVSDGAHTGAGDWLHISLAEGLAADETDMFGFFEDRDRSVWIFGEEGLTHLRPDASWFAEPKNPEPPRITRVDTDAAPVRMELGGLRIPAFRDPLFRYRLLPGEREWRVSRNGALEFRKLGRGTYRLEAAYAGSAASPVARLEFTVGAPALWSPWMWIAPAGAGLLAWTMRRRLWMERLRIRLERAWFVARRRIGGGRSVVSGPIDGEAPDRSGEVVGATYRLVRPVSRGGFSVVYEAKDLRDGRRAAVKVLTRGSSQDGWIRERFAAEVAALSSIDDPGVVTILDSWIEADGAPCLTMPFLDGETLAAALRRGPLSAPRAGRIVEEIAASLAVIHGRGVVHRDLKPENIVLPAGANGGGRAVLIDFGSAGLRGAVDESATTTVLTGSYHYMAPERLMGRYSAATDLYGLAVVALEMLTCRRLSDLAALPADDDFVTELAAALEAPVGCERAQAVAAHLASAFAPAPAARPQDLLGWGAELRTLLEDQAVRRPASH